MARIERRIVLGLGSSLGDRSSSIEKAIFALGSAPFVTAVAAAPLYETPPFGGPPQGDYLNSALLLRSALPPAELLALAVRVERSLGRIRPDPVRWGPRTIDVDVLWIEGEVVTEPDLSVPHPGLWERPFAVRPLVDVAPDARDPRTGALYSDAPAARSAIRRWGPPPEIPALG